MKIVLTYGTYDLFHIGHVNLLRRLKEIGDYLIVGISTDEFNLKKGKKTIIPFEQRFTIVESCRYVDKAIPEKDWTQKLHDIKKFKVDLLGMGDDWQGKFDEYSQHCEVIYLPRTKNVATTGLKETFCKLCKQNLSEDCKNVLKTFFSCFE